MYHQLLYYDSLFDVDKAKKRAEVTPVKVKSESQAEGELEDASKLSSHEIIALAEQNRLRFDVPRKVVEKYLSRCGRRYVDMHNIFTFV